MKPIRTFTAAALLAGLSVSALAEELSFAHFVPPQHTITASLIDPLAKGVAEETGAI